MILSFWGYVCVFNQHNKPEKIYLYIWLLSCWKKNFDCVALSNQKNIPKIIKYNNSMKEPKKKHKVNK